MNACRSLALFVLAASGIAFAGEEMDAFAPPPFDVAFFAPESLDEVDATFGAFAQPLPGVWNFTVGDSFRDLRIEVFRDVLRLAVLADQVVISQAVGDVSSHQEAGVVDLVSGLRPWKDRRPGDSLLAHLGEGHDRWKVRVKPGPVPTVILRANW